MPDNYDFSNQFAQPNPQYSFQDLMNAVTGNQQPQGGGGQQGYATFKDPMEMWRAYMKFAQEETAKNRATELERQGRNLQAFSPQAQAQAFRYARDPVGAAISNRDAEMATHGGIDWFKRVNNIPEMTPQEAWRTQGNTAMNQWRKQWGTY